MPPKMIKQSMCLYNLSINTRRYNGLFPFAAIFILDRILDTQYQH